MNTPVKKAARINTTKPTKAQILFSQMLEKLGLKKKVVAPVKKPNVYLNAILLYSKGQYIEYNTREVEADLAVMFGHIALLTPEYFQSKRGREDMIRILAEAYYEFRHGQISKQDFWDIVKAPYDWLGDRTISTFMGLFQNSRYLDDNDKPLFEMPEIDPKIQHALKVGRSVRDIQRVSEEREREESGFPRYGGPKEYDAQGSVGLGTFIKG